MARRNLAEKRLAWWIAFCSDSQCRDGLRRGAGPEFGRANIERAAAAFGLDAGTDRDLLLGILSDSFPSWCSTGRGASAGPGCLRNIGYRAGRSSRASLSLSLSRRGPLHEKG
jgi:hypothetical protein